MNRTINKQQKIIMAMSGGVDSSVAAFLLLEQGYQVIGATFENGYGSSADQAAQICQQLGIKHHRIDISELFAQEIVHPFVEAYLAGKTPNPCVLCNERVKFSIFTPLLTELQADYLATGHYVRLAQQGGRFILRRAVCAEKDQSYFMYRIPQHILSKCLFPLGEYTKEQVRAIAGEHHLASARQKDSYDICFIESGDYRQCLGQASNNCLTPGDIIDKTGRIVGQHQGLANYTIGQRRGVEVALGYPAYVVALDMVNNQLVLGEKSDLLTTKAQVEALTFLPFERLASPIQAQVKIRYQAEPVPAIINPDDHCPGCADIIFERPVWAVTPGQSAVIYDGETLIGGGYLL